jgi:hypothetical protein
MTHSLTLELPPRTTHLAFAHLPFNRKHIHMTTPGFKGIRMSSCLVPGGEENWDLDEQSLVNHRGSGLRWRVRPPARIQVAVCNGGSQGRKPLVSSVSLSTRPLSAMTLVYLVIVITT